MGVLKKLPGETSGYPLRPWQVDYLFDLLGRGQSLCYGSYWRDWIMFEDTSDTGDIDMIMSIADFQKLPETVRRQFRVSANHLAFRKREWRKFHRGRNGLERPYVLESRWDSELQRRLKKPVGLTLVHALMPADLLVRTVDLGFCQVVDDGEHLYITDLFLSDTHFRRITLARVDSLRDVGRSFKRVDDALEGRYRGWTFCVPPRLMMDLGAQPLSEGPFY